jgi:hypothetical protein
MYVVKAYTSTNFVKFIPDLEPEEHSFGLLVRKDTIAPFTIRGPIVHHLSRSLRYAFSLKVTYRDPCQLSFVFVYHVVSFPLYTFHITHTSPDVQTPG